MPYATIVTPKKNIRTFYELKNIKDHCVLCDKKMKKDKARYVRAGNICAACIRIAAQHVRVRASS